MHNSRLARSYTSQHAASGPAQSNESDFHCRRSEIAELLRPEQRPGRQGRQPTRRLNWTDRSDFHGITGSHEGAFPAGPAAGDHPRGLGGLGEPVVRSPTHPPGHAKRLVVLWKMSPAWQREAGAGPYNPGKMAVAARSPKFSHPTEMPRDLAGWGLGVDAASALAVAAASISRPQSSTSTRRTQINAAPVRPNACYHVADLRGP
jgi:hypothetical protein